MSRPHTQVPALALALALAAVPARATAQIRVSGSAGAFNVQHRVLAADTVQEQTGVWFGAEGAATIGRARLSLGGLFGSLAGGADSTNPDATVRLTTIRLSLVPSPAVSVGAEVEARRFETDLGVTTWRLIGLNARLTPSFGVPGLQGLADVTYYASASVVNGPAMGPAYRTTFGVEYLSPNGPLTARLGYRFERFDFKAATGSLARLEQFRGIVGTVGVRLGR